MKDLQKIKQKFTPEKIYTLKQILKIICPSQSSTAEYIFTDMLCAGYFQQTIDLKNKEKTNMKNNSFLIFLNKKHIDTVFYSSEYFKGFKNFTGVKESIKRSLVDHDGYDPNIKIR